MNDTSQETPKQSWWQRLTGGLKRTSSSIGNAVADLVIKRKLDRAMLDDIEEVLLRADLGTEVAVRIADAVGAGRYDKAISADEVKAVVAAEVEKVLGPVAKPLEIDVARKPFVILVAGVNGTGKTTTIGKLAKRLAEEGAKVTMAAGDTFRAAAIEQLRVWADRTKAPNSSPASRAAMRRALPSRRWERPRQRQRHSSDRHGRPPAEQGRPDGRTGKDRARDQEARPLRAPCRAAGAGRHHRPERAIPGRGLLGRRCR